MRFNSGLSYFFPNDFVPWFRRVGAVRLKPVLSRSAPKGCHPPQQKLLEMSTLALNLRPKAFPSAGEECLRLGVPPRGQSADISTIWGKVL